MKVQIFLHFYNISLTQPKICFFLDSIEEIQ